MYHNISTRSKIPSELTRLQKYHVSDSDKEVKLSTQFMLLVGVNLSVPVLSTKKPRLLYIEVLSHNGAGFWSSLRIQAVGELAESYVA